MFQVCTGVISAALVATPALADSVNDMCPIGKEPIVASAGTINYKDVAIGLCCPGCKEAFRAWDEARKDAFVASAEGPAAEPERFGDVFQHGTMREVMREGADQPRVALERFAGRPGVVAVGALAGLEGEIVILKGEILVSRVTPSGVATSTSAHGHATLLTFAEIDDWSSTVVEAKDAPLEELLAREISGGEATPFILKADAAELDLHIANGFCPVGVDPKDQDAEPWRWTGSVSGDVVIVGFRSPGTAGVLTHHGTDLHAHAVVEVEGQLVAAHVDAARLLGPVSLRTPRGGVEGDGAESREARVKRADRDALGDRLLHYPLEECVVSGQPLGSMGEPIDMLVDGRLVRLCCEGCVQALENDPAEAVGKLNATIVEKQAEKYPLETCVISGAKLGSMGEPVNAFHENRLARLCCAGCIEAFTGDPEAAMRNVDDAYADAQREDYPLETCVVSGARLGSMGEPVEVVAGTRLVRFCCAGCLPAFQEEPRRFLEKLPQE